MFAITHEQMIAANMANACQLLSLLEARVEELEREDLDTSPLDHYSYTIAKVKEDFHACGYVVNDYYDSEEGTLSRTIIFDEINEPTYGRIKHDIFYLIDEDDEYLNNLTEFCLELRSQIEARSGSELLNLAYLTEIRRRIAHKQWIVTITWPALRVLGAIGNKEDIRNLSLDTSIEDLAKHDRNALRTRYSDEHLLNQLFAIRNKAGRVTKTVDTHSYKRISFHSHAGIVSLNWLIDEARHSNGTTRIHHIPHTLAESLPGTLIDDVIDHPLYRNLGLKVKEVRLSEQATEIMTDEQEERNLIVLQKPLS